MKTTLRHIRKGFSALSVMAVPTPSNKLPAKAAYSVGKLFDACQSEMERYEKLARKIFEDAGCTIVKIDERSSRWTHTDPEKLKAAEKTADDLLDMECTISALQLDLSHFQRAGEDCDVPGAFVGLGWAVKTPE
ncbi:MAG: hypothetical protein WA045_14310 [Nitrospira sp.]